MPSTEPPSPLPAACLNCGQPFAAPRPRYCPNCAQESNPRPPTLGEFLQQFGGAYFATEGALWRTLKLLLLEPGELTLQYLAGRRKHFVLPLRLYLSVSLFALLLMRLAPTLGGGGTDDAAAAQGVEGKTRNAHIGLIVGQAGFRQGVFYCENLPPWLCRRIQARLDVDPKTAMQRLRATQERLAANASAVMFVLMPVFALGLSWLYRNRRLYYTEHLVFALHLHAFWFLVFACMQVDWAPVEIAGAVAVPGYALLALRHVYGGRWWALLLRAAVLGLFYALFIGLTVSVAALFALLV